MTCKYVVPTFTRIQQFNKFKELIKPLHNDVRSQTHLAVANHRTVTLLYI